MSALTIGDDEFITLTLGAFNAIDPGYQEDSGGELDDAMLDEIELDGETN